MSQMSLKLPFLVSFCSASVIFTAAFQLTDLLLCFNLLMSSTILISIIFFTSGGFLIFCNFLKLLSSYLVNLFFSLVLQSAL